MFFSRAILAAENKPSIVHVKLFARFLHSDLVRQLQCLDFKVLIVPFHCLSSFLFRQFWHCTFIVSFHIVADDVKTAQKPVSGSNLFPVTASSEAGFFVSLQSLPAVLFLQNVHGWTWFCSATSLTFRQTRYQVLYTDV